MLLKAIVNAALTRLVKPPKLIDWKLIRSQKGTSLPGGFTQTIEWQAIKNNAERRAGRG